EFSSPTNNLLRVYSNIKNQAVIQDGRVDIQTKNAGYGGAANKNMGRNRNQMFNAGNASDESNQIVQSIPRTDSTTSKANVEQMLLAMKDEVGSHLNNKKNDFMLDNAYGEESLDEFTASVMLMARLQPADETTDTVPAYDDKVASQLAKKAFRVRENQYLEDIVDLEEKLSSHDRIVYKIGKSLQTIHMLRKKPNKIYDPFLKSGLGY
ncbi:hypothetical protein Tco_0588411, partial [Tanacetum coccineum]